MKKALLFTFATPFLLLSSSTFLSCNKNEVIEDEIRDEYVNPQYRAIAPKITATEFNKTFKYGDIIKMTIIDKNNKNNTLVLPYVTEYAEAGYYGSCLCDESDGSHAGRPEKDYVNISFAMHPFSYLTDDFLGCKVTFSMYYKEGFKNKREAANCTNKLTLEELGYDTLAYANFRDVSNVGDLKKIFKPNAMYRGCSPINSGTTGSNRFDYANDLLESYNINLDICLNSNYIKLKDDGSFSSCVASDIDNFINKDVTPYVVKKNEYICNKFQGTNTGGWENIKAYEEKNSNMCCVALSTDFYSSGYKGSPLYLCGKVFAEIGDYPSSTGNTFYIHCEEGKDRTGFICAALEAYATPEGAESNNYLDSIVADFMLSYKNYFNVTLSQDINRYQDIADLTIYRHLYGICLGNFDAAQKFTSEDFNWLEHNSMDEVKKMLTEEPGKNLHEYGKNYVKNALTEFFAQNEEHDIQSKVDGCLTNITKKICVNK